VLPTYLIGLREGLEATLIVSILLGYVVRLGRRDLLPRIWWGIGLAVALSLGVGAVLTFGTYGLTTQAQEAIGGGLSIVAVGFVTWMIFWMVRNSTQLSKHLRSDVDRAIGAGSAIGIVLLAFLSVGREGVETSLFIWAAVQSAGQSALAIGGAALGIATAVALGVLLSRGLLKVNLGRFFTVTAGLLVIVAAGVFSYGVHDLQEANLLPGVGNNAWQLSSIVPLDSWYGTLLKGTLNFSPDATWLEVGAWLLYTAAVGTAFVLALRHRDTAPARVSAPATVAAH
jgi:high-affinity iron transporter